MTEQEIEQLKSKAAQFDQLNEILKTPEGLRHLRDELNRAESALGITQDAGPDMNDLTSGEQALYKMMQERDQAYQRGMQELTTKIEQVFSSWETDKIAATGVMKVKEDLGIDLTPQQLAKAMLESGQKDPTKAVMTTMADQVLAKLKTPPPTEKPNHTSSAPDMDFNKMTFEERFELLRQNPELAEQMKNYQPASKDISTDTTQEPVADSLTP